MNEEVRVVSADPTEAPVVGASKTDSDVVSQPTKRRRCCPINNEKLFLKDERNDGYSDRNRKKVK